MLYVTSPSSDAPCAFQLIALLKQATKAAGRISWDEGLAAKSRRVAHVVLQLCDQKWTADNSVFLLKLFVLLTILPHSCWFLLLVWIFLKIFKATVTGSIFTHRVLQMVGSESVRKCSFFLVFFQWFYFFQDNSDKTWKVQNKILNFRVCVHEKWLINFGCWWLT